MPVSRASLSPKNVGAARNQPATPETTSDGTTTSSSQQSNSGSSYFSGPASALSATGGLVFPNTPQIQYGASVSWEDYDLTHTNYPFWGYKNSKVDQLSVIGRFTQQTLEEADYFLGAQHFLRCVTKMNFGQDDPYRGTPPPVLLFNAYGEQAFSNVPVVVSNFNINYEDVQGYVETSYDTQVPISAFITITLQVYYNPSKQSKEFSLEQFKSGSYGGFI